MTEKNKHADLIKKISIVSTKQKDIERVPLEDVSIHPDVPNDVLKMASNVKHMLEGKNMLSEEGLQLLLQIHPPHAVQNRRGTYQCFAGLRSYQLAVAHLDISQKI